mgnify:CR=1 FL=1
MEEIYLKIKEKSELPVGILYYTIKEGNIINPFNTLNVDFNDDDESILKMEKIKEKYGENFHFFNMSDEGIDFWKKYWV